MQFYKLCCVLLSSNYLLEQSCMHRQRKLVLLNVTPIFNGKWPQAPHDDAGKNLPGCHSFKKTLFAYSAVCKMQIETINHHQPRDNGQHQFWKILHGSVIFDENKNLKNLIAFYTEFIISSLYGSIHSVQNGRTQMWRCGCHSIVTITFPYRLCFHWRWICIFLALCFWTKQIVERGTHARKRKELTIPEHTHTQPNQDTIREWAGENNGNLIKTLKMIMRGKNTRAHYTATHKG